MCGRYTQTLSADDLAAAMSARDETYGAVRANYNVAPTAEMPIVVAERAEQVERAERADPEGRTASADPARVLRMATWGLVPSWAKDPSVGARMINARAESVASKPAFRAAFATRRCLVPATGFYEWHRPGGSRRSQPYYIHPAGHPGADGLFAFAGLYEVWSKGERALVTYTILTTGAAEGVKFIHDRSPVVVPRSVWSRWLEPVRPRADAFASVLRPAPAGVFAAHPVSAEVGSVRNKGAHLIDRVEFGDDGVDQGSSRPVRTAGSEG